MEKYCRLAALRVRGAKLVQRLQGLVLNVLRSKFGNGPEEVGRKVTQLHDLSRVFAERECCRDTPQRFLVPVSIKARCRRTEQSEEHQRDCDSAEHTGHPLSFEEQPG